MQVMQRLLGLRKEDTLNAKMEQKKKMTGMIREPVQRLDKVNQWKVKTEELLESKI